MTSKVKMTLAVAPAALVAGCASQPSHISAAYVSPTQYASYDCKKISTEMDGVSARTVNLYNQLQSKADNDTASMAVGLILFWPALLFLNGDSGPESNEYAQLKGQYAALEQAAGQKGCTVTAKAPETIIKEREEEQQRQAREKGSQYPT